MGYSMYQRHYGAPLSYDLTTFQILGQKFSNFFIGILVQSMTSIGHFEITRPLVPNFNFFQFYLDTTTYADYFKGSTSKSEKA